MLHMHRWRGDAAEKQRCCHPPLVARRSIARCVQPRAVSMFNSTAPTYHLPAYLSILSVYPICLSVCTECREAATDLSDDRAAMQACTLTTQLLLHDGPLPLPLPPPPPPPRAQAPKAAAKFKQMQRTFAAADKALSANTGLGLKAQFDLQFKAVDGWV